VIRVPRNESLEIDQRLVLRSQLRQCIRITGRVRAAVSCRFPIVVKLHVDGVHAACCIGVRANSVPWCENVEGSVGQVHPVGIRKSSVNGIVVNRVVLVEELSPLYPDDFNKRRNDLPIGVRYVAGRVKPALGVPRARCSNPRVENATALRRTSQGIGLASKNLFNRNNPRNALDLWIPRCVLGECGNRSYSLESEVQVVRRSSIYP
jgi:hypothetical protein